MTSGHAERAHATWSASASARLWACPGSLKLASTVEPGPSSAAARWGTACHELAEFCLNRGFDAIEVADRHEVASKLAVEPDEEMVECGQIYIDYVRTLLPPKSAWLKVEQRFSLEALNPPFDAGGTADAVAYFPAEKMLEVVDLKGGRGVIVEVKGNPQLRTYALGAVLANPGLDVDRVKVTIVQPRAPHRDGAIRSEMFHIADLMEWTSDLLAAMQQASLAASSFGLVERGQSEAWYSAWLRPGDHCRFCPAAGICPALAERAMAEARVWFDDTTNKPKANTPDTLMPEDIARILNSADMIQDWLNSVRAYAHAQAEQGVAIPGYQLVAKRATRKWRPEAEEQVRETLFLQADLTAEEIEARKLKSPAQIEKLIGKDKLQQLLGGCYAAESSGTNLVSVAKTSREAVKPSVNNFFEEIK